MNSAEYNQWTEEIKKNYGFMLGNPEIVLLLETLSECGYSLSTHANYSHIADEGNLRIGITSRNVYYRGIGVFWLQMLVGNNTGRCEVRFEKLRLTERSRPKVQQYEQLLDRNWDSIFYLGWSPIGEYFTPGREIFLREDNISQVCESLRNMKNKIDDYLEFSANYLDNTADYKISSINTYIRNGHKKKSKVIYKGYVGQPVAKCGKYRRWTKITFLDQQKNKMTGWIQSLYLRKLN